MWQRVEMFTHTRPNPPPPPFLIPPIKIKPKPLAQLYKLRAYKRYLRYNIIAFDVRRTQHKLDAESLGAIIKHKQTLILDGPTTGNGGCDTEKQT